MDFERAKTQFLTNANGPAYFAEAEFGFSKMQPELTALKPGANVLEIGAGAGILMAMNASKFKDLNFIGVEPMGDGFEYEDVFHRLVGSIPNAEIQPVGYEDLKTSTKFDLVYLVNVFEHLPDWQDFLKFVTGILSENGRCVILCPNYSFPYEPHFQIPIIINKRVTQFLFKKKINKFEVENECDGLWKSLNFCKYRKVSKSAYIAGFKVDSDKSTFTEMIDRLDTDKEFAKRQGLLRIPITVVNKLGLISFFVKSRMFNAISPYMHLVLTHNKSNEHA